ncbi:MAG: phosphoribosylaminoimidazolesuccinocarboxamide synthase [Phycisphaerales bacterium]|nr:phosphoribosylaminoimidazolesuccinocarboxamide synthase [Phycisphaerales bacterium]
MKTDTATVSTDLPLPGRRQGKVRDIYEIPVPAGSQPRVLIVACDRISSFDVVLPTPIPGKGRILTEISQHWFQRIDAAGIVSNHLLDTDPNALPNLTPNERAQLAGRIMIGKACRVIPIECVVRGYLAGSGWVEYQRDQSVCGIALPPGLRQCDKLPEPIFTPATKAETGHDENISFDQACHVAGRETMCTLRDWSLRIYDMATAYARPRGIIIADTKFEFGLPLGPDGSVGESPILIDEALTPDSSRFWPAQTYEPGRDQDSFDKQYVRNHLLDLVKRGEWDKTPPGPDLPDDIVQGTIARYDEALDLLFG